MGEVHGYLTIPGFQIASMAQFVQTRRGGKALLYEVSEDP